jgi:hypothetical protein
MSQTSPTQKAEPDAAASAMTPATQTRPTLYALTSRTSSRSYQYLDPRYRQNDIVFHKLASSFYLFTLTLDQSGVRPVIVQSPLPTTTGNMVTIYNRAGA